MTTEGVRESMNILIYRVTLLKVYKNQKGIKVRSAVYLHPSKVEVSIGEGTRVVVDKVLLLCKISFVPTFI